MGQVFRGDTVTGGMRATASGRPDARRPISRVLPSPFRPYITNGFAPVYLAAVQLAPGWSRSLSVVGWAVRDEDVSVPIELRVVGEERLQVPAGRFDCWKLSLKSGHRRLWYWVRKSDGIGVRTLDDSEMARRGLREIVLVHE